MEKSALNQLMCNFPLCRICETHARNGGEGGGYNEQPVPWMKISGNVDLAQV